MGVYKVWPSISTPCVNLLARPLCRNVFFSQTWGEKSSDKIREKIRRLKKKTTQNPFRQGPALTNVDERQITHLICARLKYDLYDFFRGCFGAFYTRKRTGNRPKTPLKNSYRSYFRRAQIRWVIWRSIKMKQSSQRNLARKWLQKLRGMELAMSESEDCGVLFLCYAFCQHVRCWPPFFPTACCVHQAYWQKLWRIFAIGGRLHSVL